MKPNMDDLKSIINSLHKEKYSGADVVFLAGSVIRGESTKTSDLDIVVVYDSIPNAYRDSYRYSNWPVEAFVHDPQTLKYFIDKVDGPSGVPSLASMVSEGIALPSPTELSRRLRKLANDILDAGPPRWEPNDIDKSRYFITDLIEDLREPRTLNEIYAIASQLYNLIANHFFRSKGLWSAKGKTIPRRLRKIDAQFFSKFEAAFGALFTQGITGDVIVLAMDVLSEHGGFLFEGYRVEAPKEWRIR